VAEWEEMKQMTLIEMDGFLKGKCIPRDLKVNETNAEYLVRKFAEAEAKCAALAAENAVMANLQLAVKVNNNPRTRGDFFYLNSLRRVLFYGDDKCTSESQENGMESHSTGLSKRRTSTTAMTTGCCGRR
jgi:hypothetical protein